MGFLTGSMTFECSRIAGTQPRQFGPEHVEILQKHAIGESKRSSNEQARVGFLAGNHLLDADFDLEKNVFGEALHFAVRIDTNQVPAAIRRAWLQIELAMLTADSPGRRPTKAQRQEAKDAVEARCEEAARSGQFQRMQQFPVLWDAPKGLLYCGGTSAAASDVCADLLFKAFSLELSRLSSGKLALEWATAAKRRKELNDAVPANFRGDGAEGRGILEDRIESLRGLKETLDLLFQAFCERRIGKGWSGDLGQMQGWLNAKPRARRT